MSPGLSLRRVDIDLIRRRLGRDQRLELVAELLQRHAGGRRELGELVRIVEVVAAEADHVAARDRVARGVDVHQAYLRAPGCRVDQVAEGNRHEVPALHRDHRGVAAGEQELRRAVAEIARVLHVERDRVRAAQLVADVLGDERRLDAEALQPLVDLRLEDLADVHLGDPHVAVRVALHLVELRPDPPGRCRARAPRR